MLLKKSLLMLSAAFSIILNCTTTYATDTLAPTHVNSPNLTIPDSKLGFGFNIAAL